LISENQGIQTPLQSAIAFGLHPVILVGALSVWWVMGQDASAVLVVLAAVQALLFVLEKLAPAKPQWTQSLPEKLGLFGAAVLLVIMSAALSELYGALLFPALVAFRNVADAAFSFGDWPLLVQVALLYFGSDFLYYWVHRAIHRWPLVWRATGHGMHHSYHRLHAVNFGVSHPFEVLLIALPMILLAAAFGAQPEAVAGALVALVANTSMAHSNLGMNTPVFSFFLTTSDQHRRHHSAVFDESNSNYACNAIIWDRLFGTYSIGPVEQTGIGPRQPRIWELLFLPFREPKDVDTVSTRKAASR
jgi:sterol desaturase/sphingolipid hydroxylase (fatty acid hydroxylase superfamily)